MNINSFLGLLNEGSEVEKINLAVGDKVQKEFLEALASKMKETKKGKFYDNEAMAIIKAASNGSKDEYLLQHPGAVYSILKKYKQGKSNFNAADILSGGSGKDYWKKMYSEANAEKVVVSKKQSDWNTPGLKTARVKSLKNWFVIIPKMYYKDTEVKVVDIDKSHEELRKLSAEIALKDTSEPATDKNKGARVNHWCVAASEKNYYGHYVKKGERNSFFLLFVKKNKDGSPNWNDRYLYYYRGGVSGKTEFADKFDNHEYYKEILDDEAIDFISKMVKSLNERKDNRMDILLKTAEEKAEKDINNSDIFKRKTLLTKNVIDKMTGGSSPEKAADFKKVGSLIPGVFKKLWPYEESSKVTKFKEKLLTDPSVRKINNDIFVSMKSENEGMMFLFKRHLIVAGDLTELLEDPRGLDYDSLQHFRDSVYIFTYFGLHNLYETLHYGSSPERYGSLVNNYVKPRRIEITTGSTLVDTNKIEKTVWKKMSAELQDIFDERYFYKLGDGKKWEKLDDGTVKIKDDDIMFFLAGKRETFFNKKTGARFFVHMNKDRGAFEIEKVIVLPGKTSKSVKKYGTRFIGLSTDPDIEQKIQKASEEKN